MRNVMLLLFAIWAGDLLLIFYHRQRAIIALLARFERHAVALARFRSACFRPCVVLFFCCDSMAGAGTRVDCSHNDVYVKN